MGNVTKNSFPYFVEPSIEHYVLWIKPEETLTDDDAVVILQKKFPEKQFVCFKNDPVVRSVPGVEHESSFFDDSPAGEAGFADSPDSAVFEEPSSVDSASASGDF